MRLYWKKTFNMQILLIESFCFFFYIALCIIFEYIVFSILSKWGWRISIQRTQKGSEVCAKMLTRISDEFSQWEVGRNTSARDPSATLTNAEDKRVCTLKPFIIPTNRILISGCVHVVSHSLFTHSQYLTDYQMESTIIEMFTRKGYLSWIDLLSTAKFVPISLSLW